MPSVRNIAKWLSLFGCGIAAYLSLRCIVIKLHRYYKGLPVNGPVGIPLFGCMHPTFSYYIYNDKHLIDYGKKCDIFTARMGTKDVVILNDYDLAKKLYSNNAKKFGITLPMNPGLLWGKVQPILFGNKHWKERRQIIMNNIMSQHQTQYVDKVFTKHYNALIKPVLNECISQNKPWSNITEKIMFVSYIITANLVFQHNIDVNNEEDMKTVNTMYKTGVSLHLKHFYPHLHHYYFPTFISYYLFRVIYSYTNPQPFWNDHIFPILNKLLVMAQQNYSKENLNTYFDHAVHFQHVGVGNNSYKPTDDVILSDAYAIIEGKVTSVPTRSAWGIYLLALFPETYDKLYNELLNVYGNKVFSFQKIKQCHYLRAFVHETVRLASFARLDIGRVITDENGMEILTKNNKQYILPKGTMVKMNKCYLEYDTNYFKFGNTLYLEHHIINGKFVIHSYFASFGIGPRVCAGQSVVIKEMLILFASLILDGYKFQLTDDDTNKALLSLPPLQRVLSAYTRSDVYNAKVKVIMR